MPSFRKSLDYMGIEAGKPMLGRPVDVVFIGSCTNSRLSDLRQAAAIFKGRQVPASVRALVVPGSQAIKKQAEAEGLDKIFIAAGAEWRESGCSMCLGMNGDTVGRGQLCVSTSNRNFEGRQGVGARTVLASPAHRRGCGRDRTDHRPPRTARPLATASRTTAMEKITSIRSRTVVLPQADIDTDQIVPARFLTTTTRMGLGKALFADWRYDKAGSLKPDFPLNRPEAAGCGILVAGNNFGCGSSREHAPWALLDFGIRGGDQHRHRRYLPQQLAEERPRSGHRRCRHARVARRAIRAPKSRSTSPTRKLQLPDGRSCGISPGWLFPLLPAERRRPARLPAASKPMPSAAFERNRAWQP